MDGVVTRMVNSKWIGFLHGIYIYGACSTISISLLDEIYNYNRKKKKLGKHLWNFNFRQQQIYILKMEFSWPPHTKNGLPILILYNCEPYQWQLFQSFEICTATANKNIEIGITILDKQNKIR